MSIFDDPDPRMADADLYDVDAPTAEGEPPTVHLGLEYEPAPLEEPRIVQAKLGLIPPWVLGTAVVFWLVNRYFAE